MHGSVQVFSLIFPGPAVEFWTTLANSEDIPISVYENVTGYPVVVLKWAGTDSSLGSIMLNSHMDVVPADEDVCSIN